jgi:hypothetical protein
MKQLKYLLLLILPFIIASCGSDDPSSDPENPNENEVKDFYQIPTKDLQDWAEGISNDSHYILAGYNGNLPCVYVSSTDNNGVLFQFSESGEVTDISSNGIVISVSTRNDEQILSWINDNNEFCSIPIKSRFSKLVINGSISRAGSSSLLQPSTVQTVFDIIQNIQSLGEIGLDLFTSDMLEFLNDLGNFSFDAIVGSNPLGLTFVTLKNMIDGMYDSLYERHRRVMYGDCSIKIEEISNDGKGNIDVFVSIENANTIPDYLYNLYYEESEETTRNTVYWGIVGHREYVPRKYFYTEPYTVVKLLDTKASSTQHFMVSFPMPRKGDKFIFRAFLASTRLANSIDDVNDNIIKYGNNYNYNVLDAYIRDFKQVSCRKVGDKVNFICSVSGFINSVEDIIEWGVYYKDDDDSYTYFPSKYTIGYSPGSGISSPNEDTFEIPLSIDYDKLDANCYKDIKLGIYTKGGFNLTYNGWSEPQTYSVHYVFSLCPDNKHPHAIDLGLPSGTKWNCCNIGASTPNSFGDYYAWGEVKTWQPFSYSYCIYPIPGQFTGNEQYTDIGSDISGTIYDVVHAKMGDTWRIPTSNQIFELDRYCSWEWGLNNGVLGYFVKGPNGRQIFLPATGQQRDDGAIFFKGDTFGSYWASNGGFKAVASALMFTKDDRFLTGNNKGMGLSIRPCKK